MNKLKNKKGFFPLWLSMQEAICGIKPKVDLHPDSDQDAEQLPDLGQFRDLAFVFLSLLLSS